MRQSIQLCICQFAATGPGFLQVSHVVHFLCAGDDLIEGERAPDKRPSAGSAHGCLRMLGLVRQPELRPVTALLVLAVPVEKAVSTVTKTGDILAPRGRIGHAAVCDVARCA